MILVVFSFITPLTLLPQGIQYIYTHIYKNQNNLIKLYITIDSNWVIELSFFGKNKEKRTAATFSGLTLKMVLNHFLSWTVSPCHYKVETDAIFLPYNLNHHSLIWSVIFWKCLHLRFQNLKNFKHSKVSNVSKMSPPDYFFVVFYCFLLLFGTSIYMKLINIQKSS